MEKRLKFYAKFKLSLFERKIIEQILDYDNQVEEYKEQTQENDEKINWTFEKIRDKIVDKLLEWHDKIIIFIGWIKIVYSTIIFWVKEKYNKLAIRNKVKENVEIVDDTNNIDENVNINSSYEALEKILKSKGINVSRFSEINKYMKKSDTRNFTHIFRKYSPHVSNINDEVFKITRNFNPISNQNNNNKEQIVEQKKPINRILSKFKLDKLNDENLMFE